MCHIVTYQLEFLFIQETMDVLTSAGEKIIDTKNFMPLFDQSFTEMRTQKACASRYGNSLPRPNHHRTKLPPNALQMLPIGVIATNHKLRPVPVKNRATPASFNGA